MLVICFRDDHIPCLMWLIKIVAWKPVTKMMQDRSDKIVNDIDSAKESRTKAAELAQKRQAELDKPVMTQAVLLTMPNRMDKDNVNKSLKMLEVKYLILRVLLKRILNNNDKKLWLILEKMWQVFLLKLHLRSFQKN